jgi:hypothetical protein
MKKHIKKLQLGKRTISSLNLIEKQFVNTGAAAASRPVFTCNGSCTPTCFCPSPPVTLDCPVKP